MNRIKLILTVVLFTFFSNHLGAQEPHSEPEHPTGNVATQKLALPFYNEACEYYAHGKINQAKRSLQEAINTSFALTEAQLFLGKIMLEENKIDSAFYFLNSGIDFHTEQKAHVYFLMFEQGFRMGEYGYVKHNAKHFKKFFGNVDHGKYEEAFPYDVDDYEKVLGSLAIIGDYNYWKPNAYLLDTLPFYSTANNETDFYVFENDGWSKYFLKKAKWKKKNVKSFEKQFKLQFESESVGFLSSGKDLFVSKKNGKKWSEMQLLDDKINDGSFAADCFYLEKERLLYFVSTRNGNKDIFVAKLSDDFKTLQLDPLKDINTDKDEFSPAFKDGVFYFCSDGYPGFGGTDIYKTPDNVIVNGIIYPSSVFNLGKPINTNDDEVSIDFIENNFVVKRGSWRGDIFQMRFKPLIRKSEMNYDLKIVKLGNENGQ